MATKVTKSRTFAVVLTAGGKLGIYFLWKRTEVDTGKSSLENSTMPLSKIGIEARDELIRTLKMAGLTVRYFDHEEKQWMDDSTLYGLTRAPGNRDGQWGFPTSLQTFEEDYLKVV